MIYVHFFTFSPIQENTYVLWNEKNEALIIDPGNYFTAENETLKNFISQKALKPVQLLNTHCHLDHVFGNKFVAETYKLELFIHPLEEKLLEFAPASAMQFGLGFSNYKGPLHFLNESNTIKLGSDELTVIHAPGHSPGSICFYCKAQNFLIGGDVLFYESIGRTDLPGGNHEQLLRSIREKIFTLPGETVVRPGHGPQTTIAHEKMYNPFVAL